ncbi:MAG: LacI family DNA-binding transcriptional regulator [Streptosporangiaceae bacterium]
MKDVARHAGVSQSTVSRVLNDVEGPVRIAPETRDRVHEVVRELGYRPNPLARGLRGARMSMIGLLVREVADPFFAAMIEALSAELRARRYSVLLGHARSQAEDAMELTGVLETRHCDGILLLGDLHDQQLLTRELVPRQLPVLALCVGRRAVDIPAVNSDNALGTQLALRHLAELGHRRIACIDAGWLGDVAERRERYASFLRERSLAAPPGYVQPAENSTRGGYAALSRLFELAEPPTAVFASTDVLALGALKAAADASLRIPADVSVVGFDDISFAEAASPALTTVRQPVREMARVAVDSLLAVVDDPAAELPNLRRLHPRLVVRGSTGPPG